MSTSIYLQCDSHTPPILSDEVGGRLSALPNVQRHIENRELYRAMAERNLSLDTHRIHYAGNAFRFLCSHPHCDVSIRDEYGNTYPLETDEKE